MMNEPEPGRTSNTLFFCSKRNGSYGGVQRCHKCGWPYPNPHPSAKHRRSHKKACGTLEGYKLPPSSIACDEDLKVADVVESQSDGKSIRFSGSGSMSNRSTDEVFSDASPEFQDCACSSDNERGEGDSRGVSADATLGRDLSASLSFKDCSDADSFELLGYSGDGSQEQSPFVQHSIPNLPHTSLNCQNPALRSTKESLHMPINDRNGSMKTLVPVKLEKEMDECALDENADQVSKVESYSNGRVEITSAAVVTDDIKEPRQECTGGLGANVAVLPEDTRRGDQKTTSETASMSEQREASSIRENSFQLTEERDDILTSSKHVGGLSSESVDAAITSQVKKEFSPVVGNVTVLNREHAEPTSDVLLVLGQKELTVNGDKTFRSKDESNNIMAPRIDPVYPSSKSELSEQKDTSVICQEKDLAVNMIQVRKEALPETDSASSVKSNARFHSDDEDHESVHALLVPDNIPAVENAEVMLGGHEKVKFEQPVTLSSPELNSSTHALEDNSRLEDEPTRTETKVVTVEEDGATKNGRLNSSEVEEGREVCSMKEQEDQEISGDSQQIDSSECDSKVSSDVNSMHQVDPVMKQHDNSVGTDDVSNLEKVGINARIFAEIGAGGLANGLNGKDDEDVNGIREVSWKSDTSKTGPISESNNASQKPKFIMQDAVATLDSQEGSNEDNKVADVFRTSNFATCKSTLDAKSLKSSAAAAGGHSEKSVGLSSESNEVCLQNDLDNGFAKNQAHRSEADISVESGSQEDSLEGNCGSSYAVSTMDTESVAEKAQPLVRRDASPGHHSDKPGTFEEPSFMRWVQPGARNSESQEALDHPQPSKATPQQAGWFPLLANVANVSPGRRKNEERIAKVANWSMKQQVPLKNLLGEAKTEANLKSPAAARSGENQAFLATGGKVVNGSRTQAITVGAILSSEAHVEETGAQEWSSPVRHSAAIKRERKRVRPYWAQLVCCTASPVNY